MNNARNLIHDSNNGVSNLRQAAGKQIDDRVRSGRRPEMPSDGSAISL